MSEKIILSIIIPVFNVEKYLERCIKSVLSPLNGDIEIILVDDGSVDKSTEICDVYGEKYPRHIKVYHKKNGGLSSARNTGIEHASGEYLFFLDSDDCIEDDFFDGILPILRNRECDLIMFDCCLERKQGIYNPVNYKKVTSISRFEAIRDILFFRTGHQTWLRVYSRRLFNELRFPMGKKYEDIFTTHKAILASECIMYCHAQYYIYNLTNISSITKSISLDNMNDYIEAIDEFCEDAKEYCEDQTAYNENDIENYKFNSYVYIYLKIFRLKDAKKLKEYIKKYLNQFDAWNMLRNPCLDKKRSILYAILHTFKIM